MSSVFHQFRRPGASDAKRSDVRRTILSALTAGTPKLRSTMEVTEQTVHLFLFVKVRANWGDDPERFRMMGLDYSE